jgi:DNA repair exonuclease SbcCD ATPase subunit
MNSKENLIYEIQYNEISDKLKRFSIEKDLLCSSYKEKLSYLKNLKKNLEYAEEAKVIIRHIAQKTQEELQWKISEIVSLALHAVFDDPYKFICRFEIKRGKSEAVLLLERNGDEYDAIDSTGGGVVDIVSFALRIAGWKLSNKRNVIFLDEPFKHLSSVLQVRAGEILKLLSKELGLQFIIITHSNSLEGYADKLFKVSQMNGKSIVEVVNV